MFENELFAFSFAPSFESDTFLTLFQWLFTFEFLARTVDELSQCNRKQHFDRFQNICIIHCQCVCVCACVVQSTYLLPPIYTCERNEIFFFCEDSRIEESLFIALFSRTHTHISLSMCSTLVWCVFLHFYLCCYCKCIHLTKYYSQNQFDVRFCVLPSIPVVVLSYWFGNHCVARRILISTRVIEKER